MKFLENLGFEVILARNALKLGGRSAGTPEERAEDINSMFRDKEIAAIFCSQGGATANSTLPFMDWSSVRKNPKIFLGMSDITVLLNAIYSKTGLIAFHGNDIIWGLSRPTDYDRQEFASRLIEGRMGMINANGQRRTVRKGIGIGRLLGGNLGVLLKLAGTPYWPDFTGAVLFVEAYKVIPKQCEYMFHQLKQIGVFEKINGVIVGHIHSLQRSKVRVSQMEDILLEVTAGHEFPILKTDDFGHECPNTVLPVGARVKLDATAREIELLDRYVE